MRKRRPPQSAMTREDWLRLGLDALMENGPSALALEALAKRAGRTKGSFYHHFGGRRDFVLAMLALWREDSAETLAALNADLEAAIRKLDDPEAVAFVAGVDEKRIEALRLAQAAPESAAARDYATLLYAVYIGTLSLKAQTKTCGRDMLALATETIEAHWHDD